ncbi:hypothetical protein HMPREF0239_00639 [Clostridium sp. ATCC BAA-442]|uniref:Uncharacterized protein n=1 Tax=Flavonifractor plautii ATCC 29863 TaxID=411475 RepID=G9YVG7_FLAPL|nr:hypothetical protein HMPREF0372_03532 [Flavonifractor plautii ATCC 29863]ERI79885.1 hypothetical protein HMPREF0239_00639 [Clostridium sp. ATCC BAA-442]
MGGESQEDFREKCTEHQVKSAPRRGESRGTPAYPESPCSGISPL